MANQDRVEVFRDRAGEYRWRRISGGRIVADSGEGYNEVDFAITQAEKFNTGATLYILTDDHPPDLPPAAE